MDLHRTLFPRFENRGKAASEETWPGTVPKVDTPTLHLPWGAPHPCLMAPARGRQLTVAGSVHS